MPNHIYSILRVFGEKGERQKFVDYASKIVPRYREEHPLNPDDKIPAMMDKWYDYQTWENEKGTFITFFTANTPIDKTDGYQLHKLFPTLKFIYRSIDEGWPNHCGRWEFDPSDPPSEQTEKDLEIIKWLKNIFDFILLPCIPQETIDCFRKELAAKCNNDPNEIKRILDLFDSLPVEDGLVDVSDSMLPSFANDHYFELSQEELVNSPDDFFHPNGCQCTFVWENWKNFDDEIDYP